MTTAELVEKAAAQLGELGESPNMGLLEAIAAKVPKTSMDATMVAGTDDDEMDYIVKNFMADKLGESDAAAGRAALDAVVERIAGCPSGRQKQRAAVYYLLVTEYGKESVYA